MVLRQIDVLLLTHNKLRNTLQCLESLSQNTPQKYRLIVVDDSTDLTPAYFNSQFHADYPGVDMKYLRPDKPFTSGNQAINFAMPTVESEYFVFLCNSTFVEPDWLTGALWIMDGEPKAAIVGFKLLFWLSGMIIEAGEQIDPVTCFRPNIGMYEPGHRYCSIREVPAIGWAVVLIRKAAMFHLDEDFLIGFRGADDTDNCLEFRKRGWKIYYNGMGAAYHIMHSCQGGGTDKGVKEMTENYLRFAEKWKGKVPGYELEPVKGNTGTE